MSDPAPKSRESPCELSVVLLTYNHAPYVVEALRSVQAQDLTGAWEVLVADDCSPDGTGELARLSAEDDPRVRVLETSENLGMQGNLRRALKQARGRYVAFLEGDDYWASTSKLSTLRDLLDSNAKYSSVSHLTEVLVESTGERMIFGHGFDHRKQIDFGDVIAGVFPHASSLMFRRSLLQTTPEWFDDLSAADWAICGLLAASGPIGVHREVMSVYRKNEASTWTPQPQLERKLLHLEGLKAFGVNVPQAQPMIRRQISSAHSVVAAVAIHDRRPAIAFRHGVASFCRDPAGTLNRLRRRSSRSKTSA